MAARNATLSVGAAALSCTAKLSETLPALAVNVTVWEAATGDTVAENPALVASAGTVTEAGTVNAALFVDRLTISPPEAAGASTVTVQASVPDPVMVVWLHENPLNAAVSPESGCPLLVAAFWFAISILLLQPESARIRLQDNSKSLHLRGQL